MEGEVNLIAALKDEEIPLYRTGRSLVCTIGANGHVWGKPLGKDSRDNDVELEIFTPVQGGYLFRRPKDKFGYLEFHLDKPLTESQQKCVYRILAQKEKLKALLGTLMVSPWHSSYLGVPQKGRDFRSRMNFTENLDRVEIVFHGNRASAQKRGANFDILYNDKEFVFKLVVVRPDGLRDSNGVIAFNTTLSPENLCRVIYGAPSEGFFPHYKFYAARLENDVFNMWGAGLRYSKAAEIFKQDVRVMWGEYDLFDVFDVDEALLLLEEYRKSPSDSELCWTLAVAQNKIARNLVRLVSNNQDLFKGLIK